MNFYYKYMVLYKWVIQDCDDFLSSQNISFTHNKKHETSLYFVICLWNIIDAAICLMLKERKITIFHCRLWDFVEFYYVIKIICRLFSTNEHVFLCWLSHRIFHSFAVLKLLWFLWRRIHYDQNPQTQTNK